MEFNKTASFSESGEIEFNIPGTSVDCINLSKTNLHIKYVITDESVRPKGVRGQTGKPTA